MNLKKFQDTKSIHRNHLHLYILTMKNQKEKLRNQSDSLLHCMFLGRKNQYCANDYTTKHNLHIQCDPYQITNGIFHRTRKKKFTIHMETQNTPNSQSSLEKEK